MDTALRQFVRDRAHNRCEYCHIHQDEDPYFRFHLEHIVARQHGGAYDASNLALACRHCNLHKGPNLSGIDQTSGTTVPLFDPRRETWEQHFVFDGSTVLGQTPTGRATVDVLSMNDSDRVKLRNQLGYPESPS